MALPIKFLQGKETFGFDQWGEGTFQAKWPRFFFGWGGGFPQSPATRGTPGNYGQTMVNIVYPPFMFSDHVDHGKKGMVQFRMINFKTLQEHGKGGLYAN